MKWIFLAGLFVFTPAAIAFLRANQRYLLHACFVLGLAIFFQGGFLSVSPIFWDWPGPMQGVQVGFVDALAFAIICGTRSMKVPISFKLAFSVLVLGIFVSSFAARLLMPVGFYAWQLVRNGLVFFAVARASNQFEKAPVALFAGIGTAMGIEALWVMKQFAGGDHEPGGNLGHRNVLGMTTHFAAMPAFALLLAGYRKGLTTAILISAAVVVFLGGSRAALGLFAVGVFVATLLSMRKNMTGRKGVVAGAAAFLVIAAIPVMLWSVERRSQAELQSSDAERGAFIDAARMIIADHPLGVGANQYVIVANLGGYSDRAGVPWNYSDRSAPVHNSYYLVTAELGLLGLIGLISTFGAATWIGLNGLRDDGGPRSELLVGFIAAIVVLMIHIAFEWVFEQAVVQYLTAAAFGAIVGIAATSSRATARPRARPAVVYPNARVSCG